MATIKLVIVNAKAVILNRDGIQTPYVCVEFDKTFTAKAYEGNALVDVEKNVLFYEKEWFFHMLGACNQDIGDVRAKRTELAKIDPSSSFAVADANRIIRGATVIIDRTPYTEGQVYTDYLNRECTRNRDGYEKTILSIELSPAGQARLDNMVDKLF